MLDSQRALVLFSGGQDSTTALAWALDRYETVDTVGFDYGQRHRVELEVRPRIIQRLKSDFTDWKPRFGTDMILQLALGEISGSALIQSAQHVTARDDDLPSTFVPGRNLLFLLYSAIVAERTGVKNIVIGACETDYSGYPDCRDDTMKAMQLAINLGLQCRMTIHAPLMWINKAQTWEMAWKLGGDNLIEIVRNETHTCYAGDRERRSRWGFGCAECDACKLRERGWETYSSSHGESTKIAR